ncbi:hypothetical protein [Flagellimonas meridianipacifica]|uniref:Uncharacterized protein n=1 Tax=Flagellimonas meridianipacifica TaxID=1080225 RepID=A0A2T0MGE5_9FLAO|nr:hypothetical protein [Allomuricauda pacifica]PRX56658.1 hypothetical protein CLV81_0655 [Allomuricauda pacifica]
MKKDYGKVLWLILVILFITLIVRMAYLPSAYGFWFPFILTFIICGVGVGAVGAILAGILDLVLKKYTFQKLFIILSSIIVVGLHIYVYAPPLKIIVPNDFTGEVNLVVHPDNEKNLRIDSNGIGYITKSIYIGSRGDKKPWVYLQNGERVYPKRIVGYDSLFFFGHGSFNGKAALKFKVEKE